MTSLKRKVTNENFMFYISTPNQPLTKCVRHIVHQLTDTEVAAERASFTAKRQTREVAHCEAAAKKVQDDCVQCLGNALQAIKGVGFSTLAEFMLELMNTNDQQHSAHMSWTLGTHRHLLLENIQIQHPDIVDPWAVSLTAELLASEGQKLAEFLHPASRQVSDILGKWSLERIFQEVEHLAPVLCTLLRCISFDQCHSSERHDCDLVCQSQCNLQPTLNLITYTDIGYCCLYACTSS
ncbi:uncharacterized protein BJ212DRAFT_1262685 [Suillus subaureus]|uniref:Uncharacterized protein n=1 Tax=Suillus subaureus TaxID=48587 RepID=A0A9P7JIE0_9AGAM|nr:uncharacterized protein BJ212DRAFT_1262685 [Suillus subaureus]KAG1823919.1 hypothetical protein BJ212DRAFT_1262685 [Suillus subaureus]